MGKRPRGFHTPFADLKLPAKPAPPPAPPPAAAPPPSAPADDSLFDREMLGVAPLPVDPRGQKGPLGARLEVGRAPRAARVEDEAAAYAELADLVTGEGAFDISATDEYIEASAPGLDRRLVRRLRRGEYAVQAHVDLHGLTAAEAKVEVEQFLGEAQRAGHRCVLLVHGRGLHSKDSVPVLKERLKVWLTRGRLARVVLAFATARPADGGAGAVYVLLRRA